MRVFKVYFEIYGKKMKVEVKATSYDDAIRIVKSKTIIHEVVDITPDNSNDFITNFFNIVNKK